RLHPITVFYIQYYSPCIHFLFFFYCSGAHRDLHSFPTRRSSDLAAKDVYRLFDGRCDAVARGRHVVAEHEVFGEGLARFELRRLDRKSTRLNSSHSQISYAVFCLKKKKKQKKAKDKPHK